MTTTLEVAAFVDLGVECWHQGTLVEGLELLAVRLHLSGCGELLAEAMRYDWSPEGSEKGTPHPTPKDPPKPPPPPQPKGWRS